MNNSIKLKDLILPIIISLLIIFITYSNTVIQTRTKIVFCDVGQGDAIYIRTKDGIDLLIDAGPNQQVATCLGKHMPFYDKQIEYAFITHPHADHYSGLSRIQQHYNIANLYLSIDNLQDKEFSKIIIDLKQKQTMINYLSQNMRLEINQQTYLDIFWPTKQFASANNPLLKRPDLNNLSLVILFKENNFRLLLTGDVAADILERLLKKTNSHVDILKIPHHGSKYGTNKNIIQLADPKVAVISVGKNNPHGHPAQEVINLLQALKIDIKRTDQDGDVVILGK